MAGTRRLEEIQRVHEWFLTELRREKKNFSPQFCDRDLLSRGIFHFLPVRSEVRGGALSENRARKRRWSTVQKEPGTSRIEWPSGLMPNYFQPVKRKRKDVLREFNEPETARLLEALHYDVRYVFNRLNRGSCTYVESPPTPAPASRRIIDLGTTIRSRLCLAVSFEDCYHACTRLLRFLECTSNFCPRTGKPMECSKTLISVDEDSACASFIIFPSNFSTS